MSASGDSERLDPRVQVELERLNSSTDEINRLEVELDEARLVFRQLLAESHLRIQQLSRRLGVSVDKARPYYEARFRANLACQELQAAAHSFEKANSAHSAAREMVFLAEQGLCRLAASENGGGVALDPAWQEMLNHATSRVNQAEAERAAAGATHRARSAHHRAAAALVQQLQASLKRHIAKSRPYFEEKARINSSLDAQKSRVEGLERGVSEAKLSYAQALRSLERISDEIHRYRSRVTAADTSQSNGHREAHANISLSEDVTSAANARPTRHDSVREWLQNPRNRPAEPVSPLDELADEQTQPVRPKSLPQEFGVKCQELTTPKHPNERTPRVSRTPRNGPDSDNWTEINLEYSSPEEVSFEKCTNISQHDKLRATKSRLKGEADGGGEGEDEGGSEHTTPEGTRSPLGSDGGGGGYTSRVSALSPRRIIKPRSMSTVEGAGVAAEALGRTGSARGRLPGGGRRGERSPVRRQSLDVILNDTGEKVKEIFSQGFTLFNMSSRTERRVSEPQGGSGATPPRSPAHGGPTAQPPPPPRRMPSPLDKTLSYLNVYTDSDDQGSDTESLASVEMLTDEQIHSLMLDGQLEAVCSRLMGPS